MHIIKEQWQYLNDHNDHLEIKYFPVFFNEHVNYSGASETHSNKISMSKK